MYYLARSCGKSSVLLALIVFCAFPFSVFFFYWFATFFCYRPIFIYFVCFCTYDFSRNLFSFLFLCCLPVVYVFTFCTSCSISLPPYAHPFICLPNYLLDGLTVLPTILSRSSGCLSVHRTPFHVTFTSAVV